MVSVNRGYLTGFIVLVLAVVGLLCATLYANEGYAWPTEDEFRAEMVLVEEEYPGLLHELLAIDESYGTQRWARIEEVFHRVDWGAWPWKSGAFYRQFNAPDWIRFFDSYETVTLVTVLALGLAAHKCWKSGRVEAEALGPAGAC